VKGLLMRILTIIVTVLGVLYAGYWFVGRHMLQDGVAGFLQGLNDDGWTISYGDLSTQGFPSRFDTTITDLRVTHPTNGVTWATPLFQVLALSYRPTEVIAVWPAEQVITLPGDRLVVRAEGLRASAGVDLGLSLPFDAATVESGLMTVVSDRGWTMALDKLLFAFRDAGPGVADYDLFLNGENIVPPDGVRALLDPEGALPAAVDQVWLDAGLTLDQPLDRNLRGPVRLTALNLRELRLNWGTLAFTAKGQLVVDAAGIPTGEISLTAQNWRQVITLAVSAGVLTPGLGTMLQRGGAVLAGGSETLTAPLTFKDGNMALGPIPLGPAPRLIAR
jgi:hypothetical protein